MNIFLRITFLFFLVGILNPTMAQKKPYYNTQDQVVEAALLHLNSEMNSGSLHEWAAEQSMEGTYTLSITIGGKKGEVLTVRPVSRSDDGEIMQQNAIKDYVKVMRFPFKMPKDKSYQFEYEFKF